MSYLITSELNFVIFNEASFEKQKTYYEQEMDRAVQDAVGKPKSWISNKIAKFRKFYMETKIYLDRMKNEYEADPEKNKWSYTIVEKFVHKILNVIDKLAKIAQNKFDK